MMVLLDLYHEHWESFGLYVGGMIRKIYAGVYTFED
jgi:hypothetical protein